MNKESNENLYAKWQSDPANWKLGFIYRNPKDKRIMVPKRWGLGFTLNFGNPLSAILLVLLIVIPVVMAFLLS